MSNPTTNQDGTKEWYNNKDQLHRLDGPAIEYANGDKYWYQNGQLHRIDGPAAEWDDGSKYWYQNGKRHRVDGPAIECANGYKKWYLNGVEYTEEKYLIQKEKGIDDYWLGKVLKVHKIAEYDFVEYIDKNSGSICYSIYINEKSIGRSEKSLDTALATAIAYKYDGCNTKASNYFMKMIGDKEHQDYKILFGVEKSLVK